MVVGVVGLLVVLTGGVPVDGAVFVAAFLVYAVARQGLLRLRAERRRDDRTLPWTAYAMTAVAVVVAALARIQNVA